MQVGWSWEEQQSRGVHSKIQIDASLMCTSLHCSEMWMHRLLYQGIYNEVQGSTMAFLSRIIIIWGFDHLDSITNQHLWMLHAIFSWWFKSNCRKTIPQIQRSSAFMDLWYWLLLSVWSMFPKTHQSIIKPNVANQLKPVSAYTFFTFFCH